MQNVIEHVVSWAARVLEVLGVAIIVAAPIWAVVASLGRPRGEGRSLYQVVRQTVGRGILLGLEILVGADIIRTVASQPALGDVLVLALVVLIRTFLSFTLEVELEGRWPWRKRTAEGHGSGTS